MMRLDELFNISYGTKLDMNKMTPSTKEAGVAFVARRGGLNGRSGVSGFVEKLDGLEPLPSGLLTVALGGSLLSTYVQQLPFYTAQNVAVLSPKDVDMPLIDRLYYAMCIKANDFRYSAFGREANRTLRSIKVPDEPPLWARHSTIPSSEGLARPARKPVPLTDHEKWKEILFEDYFIVKKGKRVTKANRANGSTRFIGASELNNGVTDFCDLDPIFEAGTLTVPYNGSVGFAFYQDEPYFASDDVQVLVPKLPLSKWTLLFVATMIRYEKDRFTYGYKWNLARMRESHMKLPVDDMGEPDWAYMEAYMLGLPFSAAVENGTFTEV